MSGKQQETDYTEEEIDRRRDAAITRALNTPHKPHKAGLPSKKKVKDNPKAVNHR